MNNLKEYWFVILFIGTLIVGWTNIQNNLTSQEVRLRVVESQNVEFGKSLSQVALDIAVIKQILIKNYK